MQPVDLLLSTDQVFRKTALVPVLKVRPEYENRVHQRVPLIDPVLKEYIAYPNRVVHDITNHSFD